MPDNRYNGILLLRKPVGISSHDAVDLVRKAVQQKAVGHTGTLDPLAEGLLLICLGRATKVSRWLMGMDKTYVATIVLGKESPTYDSEGIDAETPTANTSAVTESDIERALVTYRGTFEQTVPPYAAVRVNGRPLYEKARRGQEVEPPSRDVTVYESKIESFKNPSVTVTVRCSKGTYIRSLAHDMGRDLGCGAYLAGLVRTRVGHYALSDALLPEQLSAAASDGSLDGRLVPIEEVLTLGAICVSDDFAERVMQGPPLTRQDITGVVGTFHSGDSVTLRDPNGAIRAVGTAAFDSGALDTGEIDQLFSYARVLG